MVDVADNTAYLNSGDINEAKKFDELKKVILECVGVVLQKLGYLKLEIQTITSAELMVEKKAMCNVIIDISKVCQSEDHMSIILICGIPHTALSRLTLNWLCNVFLPIFLSQALADFPSGQGYQPSKFPADCEYPLTQPTNVIYVDFLYVPAKAYCVPLKYGLISVGKLLQD